MIQDGSPRSEAGAVAERSPEHRGTPIPDWFPFTVMWAAVGVLALWASRPITDPDTWWHLRLGEEFRGSWSLADPGALTPFATRPWFATQWTLEVLASHVERAVGLAGVSWLAGFGVVLLGSAVYVSCRQRGAVVAASIATLLCMPGTSLSLAPRPQVASFILTAIVTTAWLKTIDDLKPRWWLVPLSWIWASTHGMWFVGVAIGLVVTLGLLLDGRLERSGGVRLSLVAIASIAAAAITPVGPKLITAPFATSKMAEFVYEWQSPKFTEFVPALVAFSIALVVVTWARGPRRPWSEILLLAFAVGWVLLSYRTIALGAVVVAPLVAGSIQSWLPADRLRVPRWEALAGLVAALAILVGLALSAPNRGPAPLDEMRQINMALETLPQGTIVYNEYTLGGWLEWRHRNVITVVDGMTDAYEVDHVSDYVAAGRLEPGWLAFVAGSDAQYALLESDSRLAAALIDRADWRVSVRESGYVMLQKGVDQ